MKYIARFHTGPSTSYMMDIFLVTRIGFEDVPEHDRLTKHAAVLNEIERSKRIIRVDFFQEVPNVEWSAPKGDA